MAIRIEWSELLPWAGVFASAAVVALKWSARNRKEQREFAEAEAWLRRGKYVECLRHLVDAHDDWRLNQLNLTPSNIVRDIDRLIALIEMIGAATAGLGSPADVAELLQALREWRAVFADKRHFKWGSHTLKPEFAEQERALEQKIGQLRTTLHRTCLQRVRQ